MRRTKVLFMYSALAPSAAFLVGCSFDNSNNQDAGTPNFDGSTGGFDSSQQQPDSGPAPESGPLPDGTTGEAGPASGLIPTQVDFQTVNCGDKPASQTFTVQNTGPVAVTYSASITGGSANFAITGASSGTVAPGQTGSITLTATVPAGATAGQALTGEITVTTNVPGFETVKVPLKVMPSGGSLVVGPTTVGFGQAQIGTKSQPLTYSITNVGNAAVSVAVGAATDTEFTLSYKGAPAAVTLLPGQSLANAQAVFAPTSAGDKTATAPINVTGTLCASGANTIPLTGTGTTAQVTVGPSPLDYGNVACGLAGKAQKVTITNNYTFAVTYTASLGKSPSPFTIDAPSGSVPANGTVVLTITPSPITKPATVGANDYGDTMTVTTNAPGVSPATVTLKQTATGAILAVNMPTTGFGQVPINTTATLPFTVVNSGNVDAPVVVSGPSGLFGASPSAATAPANGGSVPGTVSYKPVDTSTASTTLTVTTTAALCADITPVSVTGQGEAPDATFPGGPYTVEATCAGTKTPLQAFTIVNNGSTPLQLSNVGSKLGHVQVLSYPIAPIPPGGNGQITFQAKDPVIGTDLANTYSDGVSFTTNEVGNPTHTVPVTVIIHGANLAFTTADPFSLQCYQDTYGVRNTGDMDATVLVSKSTPYPYGGSGGGAIEFDGVFTSPGQLVAHAGGVVSENIFYNGGTCSESDTLTFANAPGSHVCKGLPTFKVNAKLTQFCSSSFCFCQQSGANCSNLQ